MKDFAIKLVWFVTVYVFTFAGLCHTSISLSILMNMLLIGIFLILYMVYTVLHDHYTTSKTFKDWYEDHSMKTLNEEENE